jgi:hypothetical protein
MLSIFISWRLRIQENNIQRIPYLAYCILYEIYILISMILQIHRSRFLSFNYRHYKYLDKKIFERIPVMNSE